MLSHTNPPPLIAPPRLRVAMANPPHRQHLSHPVCLYDSDQDGLADRLESFHVSRSANNPVAPEIAHDDDDYATHPDPTFIVEVPSVTASFSALYNTDHNSGSSTDHVTFQGSPVLFLQRQHSSEQQADAADQGGDGGREGSVDGDAGSLCDDDDDDGDDDDVDGEDMEDDGEQEVDLEEEEEEFNKLTAHATRFIPGPQHKTVTLSRFTLFFDYHRCVGEHRDRKLVPKNDPVTMLHPKQQPLKMRFKIGNGCQFTSVINTFKRAGMERTTTSKWNILWSKHLSMERFGRIGPFQKVNHFPATWAIGRKDRLARNFTRARSRHGSKVYNYVPESYILPNDGPQVSKRMKEAGENVLWITKPISSSCGKGIRILSRANQLPTTRAVVCRYVANPLLINGRKFDLRLYVLVTCFDPLRVYLYDNGLVRFCADEYSNDRRTLRKKCTHLTNYSINKKSQNFVANEDASEDGSGGKWSVRSLKKYFKQNGVDDTMIWAQVRYIGVCFACSGRFARVHVLCTFIAPLPPSPLTPLHTSPRDIVVRTVILAEPAVVSHMMRSGTPRTGCFEVGRGCHTHTHHHSAVLPTHMLRHARAHTQSIHTRAPWQLFGFDVLIDSSKQVWLMEVNVGPSVASSSPLDKEIKSSVMADMFDIVGLNMVDIKQAEQVAPACKTRTRQRTQTVRLTHHRAPQRSSHAVMRSCCRRSSKPSTEAGRVQGQFTEDVATVAR